MAGLREKARHTVEVRFGSPPPPGAFAAVPGITDVRLDGSLLRCTMQGEVDPLIKALSRYHVRDLNSHEADLEETFLALYGEAARNEHRHSPYRITGHGRSPPGAARVPAAAVHLGRAFAGLIALYAVIWPSVRGNTSWRNLFDTLPQTYRALFTASGTIDLSTAGGYLGVELMGFMGPALIAVYAITPGRPPSPAKKTAAAWRSPCPRPSRGPGCSRSVSPPW